MGIDLSDEQKAFTEAVDDFCRREAGTREQRGDSPHHPGMQMMGGYGYATEYDMERHVRATLVATVYGGTSEIQRDMIGKTHGL